MDISVTAAAGTDTGAVMHELLAPLAARGVAPDFVSVHLGSAHDAGTALAATARLAPRALHGATSSRGVMTGSGALFRDRDQGDGAANGVANGVANGAASGASGGAAGGGIGVFAIWDAEGDYGTGRAALDGDARAAGRLATERALAAAGRQGEAPDLVWLSAVPGAEEAIVAGIEAVVGPNTPILGGSAADDNVSGDWKVMDATGSSGDGVVVSVLFPSGAVSTAYQSGYTPTGTAGTVTRAEGRVVHEIDGRPAGAVYAGWTGGAVAGPGEAATSILAESTFFPLGRAVATVSDVPFHLLAHPAEMRPDGGLGLFAEIAEGEVLQLMAGSVEGLTGRAGRVAAQAAQGAQGAQGAPGARHGTSGAGALAGGLVIYCGGCMMAVQDHMDSVAADIDAALGGAPWLGIFTFGEQGSVIGGQNRHGNLMISCATFSR
ncbi:MAG: FIST N-terminal domain-containing protein [Pseudomonadota bacterium]